MIRNPTADPAIRARQPPRARGFMPVSRAPPMVTHPPTPSSRPPIPGARILVVEARFYADLADELLRGARAAIEAAGAAAEVLTVDGALEIPAAAAIALDA